MNRLHVLQFGLAVFPLLFATRFAATAVWSLPNRPDDPVLFDMIFWAATVASVYWSTIVTKHLKRSAYIGMGLAFLCMFRAFTVMSYREQVGDVVFVGVLNWATFSLATLVIMTISIQYIIITQNKTADPCPY